MAEDKETSSDLLSDAELLAGAGKSFYSHDTDGIDKGQVAGAAADILGAAEQYGNFEDNSSGFGKYADQAENYLEDYSKSSSTTADPVDDAKGPVHDQEATPPSSYSEDQEATPPPSYSEDQEATPPSSYSEDHDAADATDEKESAGGGYGDFINLAKGFLK